MSNDYSTPPFLSPHCSTIVALIPIVPKMSVRFHFSLPELEFKCDWDTKDFFSTNVILFVIVEKYSFNIQISEDIIYIWMHQLNVLVKKNIIWRFSIEQIFISYYNIWYVYNIWCEKFDYFFDQEGKISFFKKLNFWRDILDIPMHRSLKECNLFFMYYT